MKDGLRGLRAVWTNRGLRRLQLVLMASTAGHWGYLTAITVWAYAEGGAALVGIGGVVRLLPAALLAPFAAALVDRAQRHVVLAACEVVRAGCLVVAGVLIAADAPPAAVLALLALSSVFYSVFQPARAAITPALARTPEELTAANAAGVTVMSAGSFVAPALGGALLVVSSPEVVLWVVAGVLLWSSSLCLGLPARVQADAAADGDDDEHAGMLAGIRTVWRVKEVRLLVALFGAQCAIAGSLEVFTAVVALDVLDLGNPTVGVLTACIGAGGVLGAAAAVAFSTERRLPVGVLFGLVLWGLPLVLVGLAPLLVVALVAFALIGLANTVMDVAGETLLQRTTPDAVLGRVFGALETVAIGSMVLGAALAPVLVTALGAETALVVAGAALPLVALASWPALRRLQGAAAPTGLDRLRTQPAFALLSPPVLDRLARRLVVVEAHAGDRVIAQGDVGDRWYVVDAGELEVVVDGTSVRTIGPGDAFGEIALLRDVPRTATVRATGDARLLALDREDFLPAVSGDGPVRSAMDGVVRSRLGRASPVALREPREPRAPV